MKTRWWLQLDGAWSGHSRHCCQNMPASREKMVDTVQEIGRWCSQYERTGVRATCWFDRTAVIVTVRPLAVGSDDGTEGG